MEILKNMPLKIPNQLLMANKFEIWSKGKKVKFGDTKAQLWAEHENPQNPNDGIKMTVRIMDASSTIIYKYIKERFYFDVAFASKDRLVIAIIPEESNIVNSDTYDAFVNFAPFITRDYYNFENEMPFACSLFYDEHDNLEKVNYSNGMNSTLIVFTK